MLQNHLHLAVLATVTLLVAAASAEEIDLTKVERTILREPAWQSKSPTYCLFVVSAEKRVWFVADGDDLYMDINGNGDLTEPGEKLPWRDASFEERDKTGNYSLWHIPDITGSDGQPAVTNIQIYHSVSPGAPLGMKDMIFYVLHRPGISVHPTFADSAKDAPIIHPTGPVWLEVKTQPFANGFHVMGQFRVDGLGSGTGFLIETHDLDCKLEFPLADGKTVVKEMELSYFTDWLLHRTNSTGFPEGVVDGNVKITVSVPQPTDGRVVPKPVTFEKKVADLRGVVRKVDPVAMSAVESRAPLVVDEAEAAHTLKWHVGGGPGPENSKIAFSPDGTLRASSDFANRTVVVRDEASGREVLTFRGHGGPKKDPVYSLAFSPDGKRVASGSLSGKVKVWDATSGEETLTLAGHTPRARKYFVMVESVAFSPDGKRLASASADGTVKVWDTTSGLETLTLKRPVGYVDWLLCVTFSPDGSRIASMHKDGSVRVWDAASREETLTLKGHFANTRVMAFSRDGKRLAICRFDGWVTVWDATSGEKMLSLAGGPQGYYKVWNLAFSPDGTRLASATYDRTVTMWDVAPRPADDMAPKKPQ